MTSQLVAAAVSPGAGESFMVGAVQLLVLLALIVVVVGVPTIVVVLVRKSRR